MNLGRVGVIGRFRPLHNGAAAMLESICEQAEHVVIGIGSANKYDMRNPFTPEETTSMINLVLGPKFNNYEIVTIDDYGHLPDYSDGTRWVEDIKENFGSLDYFVSGNEYVQGILEDTYNIIHPVKIIPKERQVYMKGTIVRMAMAQGETWRQMVPPSVERYLDETGLVDRYRQEFGLQTIAKYAGNEYWLPEDAFQERVNVVGA